jgi:hypothetical protein
MAAMELGCNFYESTFGKVDMSEQQNHDELFSLIEKERVLLLNAAKKDEFDSVRKLLVTEFRKLMMAERRGQLISPE